jgi:CubicO group peptidase (beta-lactamase class C family)
VGASRGGQTIVARGYGMANLERQVPITPATVFDVASISKPFTAMSIMLLAERGRLRLDDEVWVHVPEWANRTDRVTIRHLLAHTAGLRDVFLLTELIPPAPAGTDINEHLQRILARQRDVNFPPGSEFSYNNGGYNLLAGIVSRVAGVPFPAFVETQILTPLGMTQSAFRGPGAGIHPDQAVGYHQGDGGVRIAREGGADTSGIVGNAGLSTSTGDLLRWTHNLAEPRVASRASLDQMATAVSLPDGSTSPWGLGLEVADHHGLRTVSHGGGDRGIATYVIRYPARDLAVAVLCNLDNLGGSIGALARQVASIYLPELTAGRVAGGEPARVEVTARELARHTGLYRDEPTGIHGRVYVRDGKLMASADAGDGAGDSVELTPVGADRFVIAHTSIVLDFVPVAAARSQEIQVSGMGARPLISRRVETGFTPTPLELRAFAGQYANPDLDVVYSIEAGEPGLVIRIPGRADVPVEPILPDAFYGSLVDLIRFSRDARSGRVNGFTIHRHSVRNLQFVRLP